MSASSGHYYAYCRGDDDQWYRMNDSMVSRVSFSTVQQDCAYILFYEVPLCKEPEALTEGASSPALNPSAPAGKPVVYGPQLPPSFNNGGSNGGDDSDCDVDLFGRAPLRSADAVTGAAPSAATLRIPLKPDAKRKHAEVCTMAKDFDCERLARDIAADGARSVLLELNSIGFREDISARAPPTAAVESMVRNLTDKGLAVLSDEDSLQHMSAVCARIMNASSSHDSEEATCIELQKFIGALLKKRMRVDLEAEAVELRKAVEVAVPPTG